MSQTIVDLARAYHFAATRHIGQRRKGEAAEPYVNHLTEVVEQLAEATGGSDTTLLMAAVLHDTVEDTGTTAEELAQLFGPEVAALVAEVTDDKSLPKPERKRLQIVHAAHASPRAKMIKMADKISNLRALVASPPAGWSDERIGEYGVWASRVVEGCREANAELAARFDAALAALQASR